MIQIHSRVMGQMIAHAKQEAPLEACGYLAERDGNVVKAFPMKNVDASADHFSLDPAEQFAVIREIRAAGLSLRGVYHSHPQSPARPSAEDLKLAFDPKLSYVILSLPKEDARSFLIRNGQGEEEKFVITDGEAAP